MNKRGLLAVIVALCWLFSGALALALEAPAPGEIEHLRDTGELAARLEQARALGNHRIDPYLLEQALTKTKREVLRQHGLSPALIENNAPLPAPPTSWRGMPTTGSRKMFTLLIDFSDYPHYTNNSQAAINSALFGNGSAIPGNAAPYESLSAYYQRASYGLLDLSGGMTLGWYRPAYTRAAMAMTDTAREALIKEAIAYFKGLGQDFSQFDNNGDGTIDYFAVVWTGPDNGWANFWWGYQTSFGDVAYSVDGKRLGKYSWQWEYRSGSTYAGPFSPKVIIHETGHALGLPDYYDYDTTVGPNGGVGDLDMMDGNWGDHNSFSKWVLDWLTPTVVASGSQTSTLKPSGTFAEAVLVMPGATSGDPFREFFLAQNRYRTGNDLNYPTDGMLIWHVDARLNGSGTDYLYDNSYTAHKLLKLMQADGLDRIENSSVTADAAMYYQPGKMLTPSSNPSSNDYLGADTRVNVNGISQAWPQMSAVFSIGASGLLNVVKSGAGSGSVASVPAGISCGDVCSASFTPGSTVTLTATAEAGSIFAGWSGGGCSGAGSDCVVSLTADATVTAEFFADVVLNENFDSVTAPALPAGWQVILVSGSSNPTWQTNPATVHPAGVAAHSAPNLVYFNSYTAYTNATATLVSPAFNLTGVANGRVTFWLYRDTGYATTDDLVEVYLNTSSTLSGASLLGTAHRYDTSAGWSRFEFPLPGGFTGDTNYLLFKGVSQFGNDSHLDDISVVGLKSKITPVLSWATPAAISYGTALGSTQLNASAGGVAGTFVYTPAAGTVLNAGADQTLSVAFTPSNPASYNTPAPISVLITVNKAIPVLSWATPTAITYGTALSATQLKASAGGVAGTFVYTPAAGTVLNAGVGQTLAVTFTPNDTANYDPPAEKTVLLTVNKATPVLSWATPAAITYGTALSSSQLNASAAGVAGIFVYTPAAGTVLNVGVGQNLSVVFTPTDTANYNTPAAKTVKINVAVASQSISFGAAPSLTYGAPGTVSATGGASGQPVLFSSLTTAVCTVSGNTVTPVAVGTCTIAANQAGTTNFTAAPQVTQSFPVAKATPVLSWATPAEISYGTALSGSQLNASAGGVAGTFTYTPAAGTVLNAGVAQTLAVTFTPSNTANYKTPSPISVLLTVNKATPVLSWATPTAITYKTALSASQLKASAGGVAGTFVYTPAAGTVLNAGANQTLSVTFTPSNTANYNIPAPASVLLTVNKATPVVSWATPAAIPYGTALGASQLNAAAGGVAGTFVYTPAAGTVLNVGSGQILAAAFTPTDTANYNTPAAKNVLLTVTVASQSLSFGAAPVLTYGGAPGTVSATGGASGQPVLFSSLTTAVCTVSGSTVTPVAAGTCTIAANQAGTANYTAAPQASQSFPVAKATPLLSWATPAAITYGTALSATQLNASAGGVAGTYVYTPAAGTVLNAGDNQTLSVTFTPTNIANYNASAPTTVQLTVNKATPVLTWATPAAITYKTALSASQLKASAGGVAGTYVYTPAAGTVLNAGVGQTLAVTFTPANLSNYNLPAPITVPITVNKATPLLTWATPAAISYGTALSATQLKATSGGVAGTFTYSPDFGTVLNTGVGQKLSVTFAPTDTANYNDPAAKTVLITVNKATPLLTWATPAAISYGTALGASQQNATAGGVAGTFVYTPAAGTVLNVGSGQILSVTFTPTDLANYNKPAAKTVLLTVNKATPLLTWAPPADITYGTALSAVQLNASSGGIAGTYVYTPAAGTVLNAGANQTLSVVFTPTNTANYTPSAPTTVPLTVNKATPVLTWATPAAITYKTALSASQLKASAGGVPGTYVYTPAAGTILNAGADQTLAVTFTPTNLSNYNIPAPTSVLLTVNKATPVISWGTPAAIVYGTALSATQLKATIAGGVAGALVYTPAAGTVLNAGIGQPLAVAFTPTDTANYNTPAPKTVLLTVNKATPVVSWVTPAAITYGTALGASQQNASAGSVAGSFVYTPAAGTVLNVGSGQILSVTFTPTDLANYNKPAAKTVLLTVNKATPLLTWAPPAEITYGTALSALQLNASSGGIAGTYVYTPAAGTVLNAGANQTLSVTFTPTNIANYNASAPTTVQLTVNKATPVLTWATPAAITYKTALSASQLKASAGGVPGTYVYTPAAGTVLNAGADQTLAVNFTPTNLSNYNIPAPASVLLTVNKATPVISWATPTAIVYKTALSATQLKATSGGVAGTFVYTPAAGTVLNAGVGQILSVSFTPTDTANYNNPAAKTVLLTVVKATPVLSWATPAAISYGTALSGTQLNASAGGVDGSFVYTPAAGTVLNAGSGQILSVTFTPTDTANYNKPAAKTVLITVTAASPAANLNAAAPQANSVATPLAAGVPDSIGVFRAGDWYLDSDGNGVWDSGTDFSTVFGSAGMLPVVGDWNGDGYSELGAYREGTWYLDLDGNGRWDGEPTDRMVVGFGGAVDDLPVAGDWNGDGVAELGIYRPGNNTWYLDYDGDFTYDPTADLGLVFGFAGCLPVVGDWSGNGYDKLGVYCEGQWYLDSNGNFGWDGTPADTLLANFAFAGMLPVVGDWTGNGVDRIGGYANGDWFLDQDGSGSWDPATDKALGSLGETGMVPLVGRW